MAEYHVGCGLVGDLISRQAAIDICHKNYDGILDFRSDGWTVASSFEDIINSVPSVQPVDKDINVSCKDAISRHDAIDALMEILDRPNHAEFLYTDEICKVLNELPSVHPEDCDTCKHGYFGDEQCNSCRVRYPSHYERRTDEHSNLDNSSL